MHLLKVLDLNINNPNKMSIENKMKYNPIIKDLKEDGDIMMMIIDVKSCISLIDKSFSDKTLTEIIDIIKKCEYKPPHHFPYPGYDIIIDLSLANQLINDHRRNSEGGCSSCLRCKYVKPLPDETITYCHQKEDVDIILENWSKNDINRSPVIIKYWESGCDDKKPIFSTTIEQYIINWGDIC
jgi:hypothetical protein